MPDIPREQKNDADKLDDQLAQQKLSNPGDDKSPTAAQKRREAREAEEDPFGSDEPE